MSGSAVPGSPKGLWLVHAMNFVFGPLPSVGDVRARYKRTLLGTQLMIAAITVAVLVQSRTLWAALAFFATMQLGAVFGAIWAARLKNKMEGVRLAPRA